MIDEGISIDEAARLLGSSPSTIRRRLGEDLLPLSGAKPVRIQRASFVAARQRFLKSVDAHGTEEHEPIERGGPSNAALRQVVNEMRMAQQLLLDSIGGLVQTSIPND